jgi:hypothetical protein
MLAQSSADESALIPFKARAKQSLAKCMRPIHFSNIGMLLKKSQFISRRPGMLKESADSKLTHVFISVYYSTTLTISEVTPGRRKSIFFKYNIVVKRVLKYALHAIKITLWTAKIPPSFSRSTASRNSMKKSMHLGSRGKFFLKCRFLGPLSFQESTLNSINYK